MKIQAYNSKLLINDMQISLIFHRFWRLDYHTLFFIKNLISVFQFFVIMDMNYVNKKQNNGSIKRLRSMTTENISKYAKILTHVDVHDYFLHERPFSNVKIILNQQIIWCDKASLAAASPIFREQLLKNTKDEPLLFNDIDLNDFLSMLEFIYPVFNPEINEKNISCLIELSYRFQFG
jgi:hypothetical protein